MKQGKNKQTRNETGKDSAGFNSFESCFDDAIESSAIKADFNSSTNYTEIEKSSGAHRVTATQLQSFNNPISTANYICDVTIQ